MIGNIKAMFSQVFVDKRDRDALQFLWYTDDDISKPPTDYRMKTLVFGAKSSPSCAAFALQITAEENAVNADPSVVESVSKNVCMDDLCKSCRSVDEAVNLLSQLCTLLKSKGFHLTKFSSNNKQVLSLFLQEDVAPNVNLKNSTLSVHKALGILWDAASDEIRVKVNVKERPITHRGLLSMVSQTYDPFGMLQPVLLPAKLLLQEACRAELDWDDGVGEKWSHWLQALSELQHVSLERSFTLLDREIKNVELHTFADTSTKSYGGCSYLRVLNVDGLIKCLFVMGKSNVAPLKSISIPRLELTAAVLAAKLSAFIVRELEFEFSRIVFWSAATVVLRYINNTSTHFRTFVANRIELIHTLTSADQWPTDLNPADIASKGVFCQIWSTTQEFGFQARSFSTFVIVVGLTNLIFCVNCIMIIRK